MTEENTGAPPAETPPPAPSLSESQVAVLKEHGIEVPEDGRIPVSDHLKLLNTLSNLRQQSKTFEQEREQARLAGLNEAERKIEEARIAGKTEAESQYRVEVTKANIKAEAAAANFLDPGDAFGMIPDLSALDSEDKVREAVAKLAAEKPYLLKPTKGTPPKVEQGQQGSSNTDGPSDWMRGVLAR